MPLSFSGNKFCELVFVPNRLLHVRFEILMKVSIIFEDVHVSVTKVFVCVPVIEPLVGMYVLCMLATRFFEQVSYISWTLTMEEERTLAVFERKILRKVYGPVKENELWRIRQDDELEAIIKGENIVRFIKCQRTRWLGHIERMQDTEIPKRMLYGKLYATRRRGRPRTR